MSFYTAEGNIADELIRFHFRFPETIQYYGRWLEPVVSEEAGIVVPQYDFDVRREKFGQPENAFTEYDLSMFRACDQLLFSSKCVFHGAAFRWNKKAFIFTAPSGTGKTTQLLHWKSLWDEQIQIMNGDKPILSLEEDGHLMVLPSPWHGKENLSDERISAPLGGIIILVQGNGDYIRKAFKNEIAAFLFTSILASFETKEIVKASCKIVEGILKSVPVWILQNIGDFESAVLTRNAIEKEGLFRCQ